VYTISFDLIYPGAELPDPLTAGAALCAAAGDPHPGCIYCVGCATSGRRWTHRELHSWYLALSHINILFLIISSVRCMTVRLAGRCVATRVHSCTTASHLQVSCHMSELHLTCIVEYTRC
jgi:hypothetical protein